MRLVDLREVGMRSCLSAASPIRNGYRLVIITGASRLLLTMNSVIIELRSASQPHIRPRSSNSMFQAKHGVVGDVGDSLRQLMPAATTGPASSSSSPSAT